MSNFLFLTSARYHCSEIPKGLVASSSCHLISLRLFCLKLAYSDLFGSLNWACAPKLAFSISLYYYLSWVRCKPSGKKINSWIAELWVFRFHIFRLCRFFFFFLIFDFSLYAWRSKINLDNESWKKYSYECLKTSILYYRRHVIILRADKKKNACNFSIKQCMGMGLKENKTLKRK